MIFHLALASDWGDGTTDYRISTLGVSLEQQGFIHCSYAHQVQPVADAFYRDRTDVVLLVIDPARVTSEIRSENLAGGTDPFPHIYGPLNRDAVTAAVPVPVGADGRLDIAAAMP